MNFETIDLVELDNVSGGLQAPGLTPIGVMINLALGKPPTVGITPIGRAVNNAFASVGVGVGVRTKVGPLIGNTYKTVINHIHIHKS